MIIIVSKHSDESNLFMRFWIFYALIPIIDFIIPNDTVNPSEEESKILSKQFKWRIPLYVLVICEWTAFFYMLIHRSRHETTWRYLIAESAVIGHRSSIQILLAHELFHRTGLIDRFLGVFGMIKSLYMHFYLEHIYGHHKYVATPQDPATAKLNQTLYSFLYQTITGSFRNSWNREVKHLKKRGKSPYALKNRMILIIFLEFLFVLLIYFLLGTQCVILLFTQAFFSIFLLETINYTRHYGLMRKEISPGIYEPTSRKHSWNASQWLQNTFFFKLQRHSDHHENSYKPYQCLISYKESPTLPVGYFVCIICAMIPPVWFYLINPIAIEIANKGESSEQNYRNCKRKFYLFVIIQIIFFSVAFMISTTTFQNKIKGFIYN